MTTNPSSKTTANALSYLIIILFFFTIFGIGSIFIGSYLSSYLTILRGGILAILMAGAALLVILGVPQFRFENLLPLYYFLAILWVYFYQVVLLYDAPFHASWGRSFYQLLLLLGMLIFLTDKKIERKYLFIFVSWITLNLFSLFGNHRPDYVFMLYIIGIILPGVYFLVLHVYFKYDGSFDFLAKTLSFGSLTVLAGMILIMFLATVLKIGDITLARNASDLNFGAGLLFLGWPFLTWKLKTKKFYYAIFIILFIIAVAVLSFSRTTLVLSAALLLFTFFRPLRYKKLLILMVLTLIIVAAIMPENILDFWMRRLNLSNWSDILNPQSSTIASTLTEYKTRMEIWDTGIKYFLKNPLFGQGLGSFSSLISLETGGKVEYSAAHSLLITVAAERGFFGVVLTLCIILYILFSLFWRWRIEEGDSREFFKISFLSFLCFLIFAHTTGGEIMRAGTVFVDSTISIFLVVYLIILLSWKQTKENLNSKNDSEK